MNKIAKIEHCNWCPHCEFRGCAERPYSFCTLLNRDINPDEDNQLIQDDCPLECASALEVSSERLFLLWVVEEEVMVALGGITSQEAALKNIIGILNDHPHEMTASEHDTSRLGDQEGYWWTEISHTGAVA